VRRLRGARLIAARIELVGAATEAPELLLETLFHGEFSSHLRELFDCAGPELGALLGDCEGIAPTEDFADFSEIVGRRALRSRALYYAHAGRDGTPTPPTGIAASLSLLPAWALLPWFELRAHADDGKAALAPAEESTGWATDAAGDARRTPFTAVLKLRQGRGRAEALSRALAWVDERGRGLRFDAELGGLGALHTARFVLLPRRRLLVTGVCDGSLDFLMDRLAETINPVLSAVFMHTEGFPRTRWLALGGARRDGEFRRWRRAFRAPVGICYAEFPELSA
jgi:hypothetical protein